MNFSAISKQVLITCFDQRCINDSRDNKNIFTFCDILDTLKCKLGFKYFSGLVISMIFTYDVLVHGAVVAIGVPASGPLLQPLHHVPCADRNSRLLHTTTQRRPCKHQQKALHTPAGFKPGIPSLVSYSTSQGIAIHNKKILSRLL